MAIRELIVDNLFAVFIAVPTILPQNTPNLEIHQLYVHYVQETIPPIIEGALSIRNYKIDNQLIRKVNF